MHYSAEERNARHWGRRPGIPTIATTIKLFKQMFLSELKKKKREKEPFNLITLHLSQCWHLRKFSNCWLHLHQRHSDGPWRLRGQSRSHPKTWTHSFVLSSKQTYWAFYDIVSACQQSAWQKIGSLSAHQTDVCLFLCHSIIYASVGKFTNSQMEWGDKLK